jgi:hypothetical protein
MAMCIATNPIVMAMIQILIIGDETLFL